MSTVAPVADPLAAAGDAAQLTFWVTLARAAAGVAAERAYSDGYAAAIADVKRDQHGLVADLELEARRWHLCCGPCRRSGHRNGCTHCEGRSRATFGAPHPDDYRGVGR